VADDDIRVAQAPARGSCTRWALVSEMPTLMRAPCRLVGPPSPEIARLLAEALPLYFHWGSRDKSAAIRELSTTDGPGRWALGEHRSRQSLPREDRDPASGLTARGPRATLTASLSLLPSRRATARCSPSTAPMRVARRPATHGRRPR
jgi:hypothetical protein